MKYVRHKVWRRLGQASFWLSWPALYLKLNGSSRARVVLRYENETVLVRPWYGAGDWQLAGGGRKPGESAQKAAIRETAEETGINLEQEQLKAVSAPIFLREKGITFSAHIFIVELSEKTPIKPGKPEIADAGWFTPADRENMTISRSTNHIFSLVEKH